MFKKALVSALVLTGVAGSASAAGLDYNTLDLGYQRYDIDLDGDTVKPDGYVLKGSFQLNDPFFIVAGYNNLTGKDHGIKADVDTYNLGFGYRAELTRDVDFNAVVNYLHSKVDVRVSGFGSGSDSSNGWGLGLGVRAKVAEPLELNAFVTREDYEDADHEDFASLGAVYKITPTVGVYGGYSQSLETSDTKRYDVGVRFSF